jgi:hypothetical protein
MRFLFPFFLLRLVEAADIAASQINGGLLGFGLSSFV